MPVDLFEQPSAADAARRGTGDARLAGRRAPARQGRHATSTSTRRCRNACFDELGAAGYWGLLVDKQYGGSGAPFSAFAPFLTQMAMVDPTVAGLASVHGCIGAVDPVRTFGTPEQKQRFLPEAGQRRDGCRPSR